VLQDSPRDSTTGVQQGVTALFRACQHAGVRRVVHVSALGVDRHSSTAFARSKLAADQALMACDLDWVILRPSVVIGRAAYGGSALLRGLAAMPILPLAPDTGELQIVHLDDLVESVLFFLALGAPARRVIEIAGPQRWSFESLIRLFRKWLRLAPARHVALPRLLSSALFQPGDALSLLGWRPPMRSTAASKLRAAQQGTRANGRGLPASSHAILRLSSSLNLHRFRSAGSRGFTFSSPLFLPPSHCSGSSRASLRSAADISPARN
jgi:uncharacterized protein YbjT (DUF2867 family)